MSVRESAREKDIYKEERERDFSSLNMHVYFSMANICLTIVAVHCGSTWLCAIFYIVAFQVWSSGFPASVRYYENMKKFTWKYTQFSQFNRNDTLLLVSGVLFGVNSTSGEIVIFNMEDGRFHSSLK